MNAVCGSFALAQALSEVERGEGSHCEHGSTYLATTPPALQ